jgi:hypothetical protein
VDASENAISLPALGIAISTASGLVTAGGRQGYLAGWNVRAAFNVGIDSLWRYSVSQILHSDHAAGANLPESRNIGSGGTYRQSKSQ